MAGPDPDEVAGVHDGLDEVLRFRLEARLHAGTLRRALPYLPLGTFERVQTPSGAPVRELMVYRPTGVPAPRGLYVNLHGGGFVLGDWQGDDPYCRYLAETAGCVVVNLDYLLAPEHPFPAAVHQTYDLLAWLAADAHLIGADGSRLVVGGHSAGGNLAAAASLLAARRGSPLLRGLVVDYAPLDLAASPGSKLPGSGGAADGGGRGDGGGGGDAAADRSGAAELARLGARFNAWYLADPRQGVDELASPVLAPRLDGMPPTLVVTAEHDLLRAEGLRFAERLRAAGVDTEHLDLPGCDHGFTHVGPEEQAATAWRAMAAFLRRVLPDPPQEGDRGC